VVCPWGEIDVDDVDEKRNSAVMLPRGFSTPMSLGTRTYPPRQERRQDARQGGRYDDDEGGEYERKVEFDMRRNSQIEEAKRAMSSTEGGTKDGREMRRGQSPASVLHGYKYPTSHPTQYAMQPTDNNPTRHPKSILKRTESFPPQQPSGNPHDHIKSNADTRETSFVKKSRQPIDRQKGTSFPIH
jgi:hypothetical protein